jgi:hypothetical protein
MTTEPTEEEPGAPAEDLSGVAEAYTALVGVDGWKALREAHQAMVAASEAASQTSIRNLTPDLPSMLMAKSHIQVTNELLGGLITQGEARDAEEKARKRTETRRFWITAGFALVAAVTGVWALPR